MEILNQLLPFSVSIITLIVGWLGGRRKSATEVEIIKSDHAEKLLKLNDQYLIAPLTKRIDILSRKIQRLEQALSRISDCSDKEKCPVRNELKKTEQMQPRGYRNNNPLNIRHNADVFHGETKGNDKSFKTFSTMPYGYRAAFVTLGTYLARDWNTIEKIIAKWAPPTENNTEAYIKSVERYSGFPRNKLLTAAYGADYILIVAAMSFVENGVNADINQIKAGFALQTKIKA